jgi:hypothetical protein
LRRHRIVVNRAVSSCHGHSPFAIDDRLQPVVRFRKYRQKG